MDGLNGPLDGFGRLIRGIYFCFYICLTKVGIRTASENVQLTMTFHRRRFCCLSHLIENVGLNSNYCNSGIQEPYNLEDKQ